MLSAKLRGYWLAAAALLFVSITASAQTNYSWNGSNSSSWNQPENWTPNGVPAPADNISLASATPNQLTLDAAYSISNITVGGGTLNLNGFTLTAAGATSTFSGGTVTNGTLQLSLTGTATFSGTTFGAALEGSAGSLLFNGATFNSTVSLTKTGSTSDTSTGNNTFNGVTSITNNGTNFLRLANTTRDSFHSDVTFTNSGTSYIDVARHDASGTLFNGHIFVNCTSGTGVHFGQGAGRSVLAEGKTIRVGELGFTTGTLALRNFTPAGNTPQHLTLSGTSTLSFQAGTVLNGDLTAMAPIIELNAATFYGTTLIEKTGGGTNNVTGGNVFNGLTTIRNSGSTILRLANSVRDIFNNDVTFTNTGTSYIDVARHDASGSLFNGNIFVNSSSGTGVQFCQGNGTATLAEGKTIRTGDAGFTSGTLVLRNFTQTGSTAQFITLGGTGIISFQAGSTFNGEITAAAPGIVITGTTFQADASFEKTGTGTNSGTGGNTFNGVAAFHISGSGTFNLHNTGEDVFNGDIVVSSTSTGHIQFGQSTGSATQAAGKTIRLGNAGFSGGSLKLSRFRQLGSDAINLSATGTASFSFLTGTIINGNLSVVSSGLVLGGATFNGTATFVKTGAGSTSPGGNTFNGPASFTNAGSSFLRLANVTRDVFNADVIFTNSATGSSYIDIARNDAAGTLFNGNIILNNTSGTGIHFCQGTGVAILAAGKTISTGSTGITAGSLFLRNFIQEGTTAQSLVLAGTTSQLHLLPGTVLNGDFTATAPSLFLSGASFNGTTALTKTGSVANEGAGGCTFNGPVTITNTGSGNLTLAGSTGDDFNSSAHFIQLGTGLLQPVLNGISTFAGDISTTGSAAAIVFANGPAGSVVVDGTTPQVLFADAAFPPQVHRLTIATSEQGKLQLHANLHILSDLAFSSGIIQATSGSSSAENGLLILQNGISFSEAPHHGSHVSGYVRKVGDAAFTFPTGNGFAYRPISISAPALSTDHFTAAYFNSDPDEFYSRLMFSDDLKYISHLEYWMMDRTGGSSAATVTLAWDKQSGVTDPKGLLAARWDGTAWVNEGNGGITETGETGTLVTSTAVSTFSPFTFGSFYTPFGSNSFTTQGALPVELTSFTATAGATEVLLRWKTATEKDNAYFTVERSADGKHFKEILIVEGSGNSSTPKSYQAADPHPLPGISYYRLRQTDYSGAFSYSAVVAVESKQKREQEISVYPNPARGSVFFITTPTVPTATELEIKVHDIKGSTVYTATAPAPAPGQPIRIEPAQQLKSGLYILTVTGTGGTSSTRLVVQ